jgi:hypothetical protein
MVRQSYQRGSARENGEEKEVMNKAEKKKLEYPSHIIRNVNKYKLL